MVFVPSFSSVLCLAHLKYSASTVTAIYGEIFRKSRLLIGRITFLPYKGERDPLSTPFRTGESKVAGEDSLAIVVLQELAPEPSELFCRVL